MSYIQEVQPSAPEKPMDMDAQMLGGCSAFVISSLMTYGLGVWPFFVFAPLYQAVPLFTALGISVAITLVFAVVVAKRAHMAGGFGAVAGVAALGVFFYLAISQSVPLEARLNKEAIEYPTEVGVYAPMIWGLATALLVYWRSRGLKT